MAKHNTNTWPGIFEYLIGRKPEKTVWTTDDIGDFNRIYGHFMLMIDADTPDDSLFDPRKYAECFAYTHTKKTGADNRRLASALKSYRLFVTWKELVKKGIECVVSDPTKENAMKMKLTEPNPTKKKAGKKTWADVLSDNPNDMMNSSHSRSSDQAVRHPDGRVRHRQEPHGAQARLYDLPQYAVAARYGKEEAHRKLLHGSGQAQLARLNGLAGV